MVTKHANTLGRSSQTAAGRSEAALSLRAARTTAALAEAAASPRRDPKACVASSTRFSISSTLLSSALQSSGAAGRQPFSRRALSVTTSSTSGSSSSSSSSTSDSCLMTSTGENLGWRGGGTGVSGSTPGVLKAAANKSSTALEGTSSRSLNASSRATPSQLLRAAAPAPCVSTTANSNAMAVFRLSTVGSFTSCSANVNECATTSCAGRSLKRTSPISSFDLTFWRARRRTARSGWLRAGSVWRTRARVSLASIVSPRARPRSARLYCSGFTTFKNESCAPRSSAVSARLIICHRCARRLKYCGNAAAGSHSKSKSMYRYTSGRGGPRG